MKGVNWRKPATLLLTVAITAYLLHKVYSEASRVHLSPSLLLSPHFIGAVGTGALTYLLYSTLWYVYFGGVTKVSFRRVFLATLVGTYLSFSLNPAIGTLVKVRLLGVEYWVMMGVGLLAIATEFLAGLLIVVVIGRNQIALLLAGLLVVAIVFDKIAYYFLYPFFYLVRSLRTLDGLYKGWHEARKDLILVIIGTCIGIALVMMNSLTLVLVGRTLNVWIPFLKAVEGVLYSGFLGGLLGTPGGIGANELGLTFAIGDSPTAIVVAFLYKFITQYSYAFVGAIAFYRVVSRELENRR